MESETIWIFGYGSLMWRPGFAFREKVAARLDGRRRAFCVYSSRHRGTAERPGLVMGLAPGGSCRGVAFRVDPDDRDAVIAYLDDRELAGYPYRRTELPVALDGAADGSAMAVVYVPDADDPRFAEALPLDERAARIVAASGISGSNREYLASTLAHLDELGIDEPEIRRLHGAVEALAADPANGV